MESFTGIFTRILLIIYFSGFMIKNILTAIRTGQPIRGRSLKINLIIINAVILGIVAFTDHRESFIRIRMLDFNSLKIIGLIIISLACILGIATLITMKDSWRVGIRPEQKTDLITNGIFRFSRNPYFLSFNLLFLGIFLEFPTLVYLIFYLSFLLVLHMIIRDEEKYLMQQHGESYKNYKDSVNRYLSLRFLK
jgi:protein-S-isoprenylcysteine O-methyltransferase Ste14